MATPNPFSDPNVTAALAQIKAKQPTTAAFIQAGLNEWYNGPQNPLLSTTDPLYIGLNLADSQGLSAPAKVIRDFVNRTKKPGILDRPAADTVGAAINAAANPLAALFQANIWLRVAEVGIGLLLVAVGVAKLTNAIPAATKIAKTVGRLPI